jgi:hypothetical protein
MTAALPNSATLSSGANGRLGPQLRELHRTWLQELRARTEKTKTKDRGIWARWEAIRYVDTVFSGQFERERRAINQLAETPLLWMAGELVSSLRGQLRNGVGLCHRESEFSLLIDKLVRAVEYWFTTVEDVVGPITWADLSPEARRELGSLGIETAPSWSDLPVSLVTSL